MNGQLQNTEVAHISDVLAEMMVLLYMQGDDESTGKLRNCIHALYRVEAASPQDVMEAEKKLVWAEYTEYLSEQGLMPHKEFSPAHFTRELAISAAEELSVLAVRHDALEFEEAAGFLQDFWNVEQE